MASRRREISARAFSFVELLVVIGIVALLVALLMPVLAVARDRARRVACAANLKNIAGALGVYAAHSRGRLPASSAPTPIPAAAGVPATWMMTTDTRDLLIKSGMERRSFYCPARDQSDDDGIWSMKTPFFAGIAATGYYWLMARHGPPTQALSAGRAIFSGYPDEYDNAFRCVRRRLGQPHAAELELVTDQTVSFGDGAQRKFQPYSGTIGHGTNHLWNARPQGGQILYLDGHVAWRPFSEMRIRFVPGDDEWF
jgi:prepilin-type processing-associated H-X9-DG protein